MRSRTAAALLSGLGIIGTGATFAVPALATNEPRPAVVDSTVPDPSDPAEPDDATVEEEAAQGTSALDEYLTGVLQPLVDDGTITQQQADAVAGALADSFPRGERVHVGGLGLGVDAVADALGLSVDEVRAALADGGSLAGLAEAQGVELQTVIDALVAAAAERLDAAVADGRLTAEQAADRVAALTEHITELVEHAGGRLDWPFPHGDGPMWHERGRRGRRHGHPGGLPGLDWPGPMSWPDAGATTGTDDDQSPPSTTEAATETTETTAA